MRRGYQSSLLLLKALQHEWNLKKFGKSRKKILYGQKIILNHDFLILREKV